ncbi:phage tail protein [Serratia fonticola]
MSKYKAILTTAGAAKIAAASAGGKPLKIDRLAVGDGNGTLPTPSPTQTKLINERYRAALNSLTVDKAAPDRLIAELIIPASAGGFWLREMGLYDADGVLIAVSNMAESYKPKLEEGSGRTQTLRMVLIVSHTEAITLIVSGDMVTATRDFVAAAIDDHAKSRNHPDATTAAKGFVQLSSATDSGSETLAATPKAVKAVSDAAVKLGENLADLPDKDTARNSLGLKAAALRDVGSSVGQLMEVGAFGLGAACVIVTDANEIGRNGFFGLTAGKHQNSPNLGASWEVLSICNDQGSRKQIFMQAGAAATKTYVRYRTSPGGIWGPFQSYYSTEDKPTAAEVGALTDAQALQKYALRSIKVNGKPLSADVNLLAGDVNAWNKAEADGRYLMKTGGELSGEIKSTNADNYRLIGGDYGSYWRNDGRGLYLLMTNAKDQHGKHNSLRPFAVNITNGDVSLGHNATISGNLQVGLATHSGDGNIMGSRWGNKWLWDAVIEQVNGRVDWNSFNNRTHVAGDRNAWWYKDELTGFIIQGGVVNRVDYVNWVGFPRGYARQCFGVQLTLISSNGTWFGDSRVNIQARDMNNNGFNAMMDGQEQVVFWQSVGV